MITTAIKRKQYPSLDIVKFLMAMLILTQHTSNEWAHSTGLVHAFFGLGNFAVPFFFACSGFLFFSKYITLEQQEQNSYYRKWSYRIGKMYLVWSSIYFVFIVYSWISHGFEWSRVLSWLHRVIVYSTYQTIWFLPALWLGVTICCWFYRHCSFRTSLFCLAVLMIIGNLFGSYSNVITANTCIDSFYKWYMEVFITWRNGVFNGAPYVFIGLMIADGKTSKLNIVTSGALTFLFCIAFLAEAFCITHFHLSSATDMGFMMAPAIYFMMLTLINYNIAENRLWIHCRNLSMLIFLGQRLFLSALPGAIPAMGDWISGLSEPLIFIYFILVVLTFSIFIERLSGKYKFLKILW